MFNFDFTSGDSRVTLLGFNGNTTYDASGYTLNLKPGAGDNMLQYSEEADNAYYTQTLMTVSANSSAAPDSTTTADGLIASAGAGPHTLSSSTVSVTAGESYVLSAYVKKGDVNEVRLGLSGAGAPSNAYADFNINTGALDSHGTGADTTTIEDAGNGFYRVSVTVTADTTGTATFDITPKDTTNGVGFTGDGSTVNTHVWGMQVNEPATDTTEITAFTNTRATINTDVAATTAPDGTSTADAIVSDATNNTHLIESNPSITVTAGDSYTFTTYAKAGARDKVQIGMGGTNFGSNALAEFDLNLGTTTSTGADLASATIEDAGSGWYRISVTATANSGGTTPFEIYPVDAAGSTFTGDGSTEDTFFWEPHVLDNSDAVAGNYVPTTSAAVSGGAATANINGTANGADDASASISGNSITVNTGSAQGLQLFFSGLDFTSSIQLDFTIGIAAQMFFEIDDLLNTTTGIVDGEIDQLTDQNVVNNERIIEMEARLDIQRQSLLERYIAMETALAQANNIIESITASTTALLNSQSG
ncbi:MAG: hypothetical protein GKS01_06295 [Alphaproteobacteria bacterium]|nr:hypothetical protein [Alphaproteobacteria bacterium]